MVEANTIKGALKQASGKAKAVVGKSTGDRSLAGRGKAEETVGKAQSALGKATSKVKAALR